MRKTTFLACLATILLLGLSACRDGDPSSTSQQISAAGGTVSLGDRVTVHIPPGALSRPATLTIAEGKSDDREPHPPEAAEVIGEAFDIRLDGAELAKPATLEIAYNPDAVPDGMSEDAVFLAYYDDGKKDWIPVVGEVDAERNVIVVQTDHLSWWNPFTWNWDAWIAVLNNALTLNLTDFVEAVQLLTDDCPQNGQIVTVDSSQANSVVQGCVDSDDSMDPEVRVVNVKSFFFEVRAPSDGDAYPPQGILAPGESLRFTLLTAEQPPLTFTAEINQRSGAYLITHLIIQMLPGLNQIGIEGSQIACITERISDAAPFAAAVEDLVVEHNGAAAGEELIRFLLEEDAVRRFIAASDDCFYGAAATWSVEGIRQIGAATATIMSATDFVANFLVNYRSTLAFNWTWQPRTSAELQPALITLADLPPGWTATSPETFRSTGGSDEIVASCDDQEASTEVPQQLDDLPDSVSVEAAFEETGDGLGLIHGIAVNTPTLAREAMEALRNYLTSCVGGSQTDDFGRAYSYEVSQLTIPQVGDEALGVRIALGSPQYTIHEVIIRKGGVISVLFFAGPDSIVRRDTDGYVRLAGERWETLFR